MMSENYIDEKFVTRTQSDLDRYRAGEISAAFKFSCFFGVLSCLVVAFAGLLIGLTETQSIGVALIAFVVVFNLWFMLGMATLFFGKH